MKQMKGMLPLAALAFGVIATPAMAQDTIRVGITLRMIVENGLRYGQMTKEELESVNASGGINGK